MSKINLGRNCPFCNAKPVTYTRDPASKREIFECYTTIDNAASLDPELNVVNRGKTCLRRQQEMLSKQWEGYEAAVYEDIKRMCFARGIQWPFNKRPSDNWAAPSRDELCEEIHLLKGENCTLQDEVGNLQNRLGEARVQLVFAKADYKRLQTQHNTLLDENRWLRSKVDN